MGDGYDHADLSRFVRSQEGQAHLEDIRQMLKGHTIEDVEFQNETNCIATELILDDHSVFVVFQPSLAVDAIREQFAEVLQREYFADFPSRRPRE